MIRSGWLAVLAVVLASLPCKAQLIGGQGFGGGGGKEYPVRVEVEGGQSVEGKLRLTEILVDCEFGQYRIKPEKVKMIRFPKPGADAKEARNNVQAGSHVHGTLITNSDGEIQGFIQVGGWTVESDIGSLLLKPEMIRVVHFNADSPPPDGSKK